MGLLGDLGRALIGAPARNGESRATSTEKPATEQNPYYDGGRKIVPEIEVTRLEPHESGDNLELWAHIKNNSSFEVEISKVAILGQINTVGRFLDANEQYEVRIYRGKIPTNDGYKKCEIYFKLVETGDYFCADHRIDYDYDDGRYVPNELHVIHPIRDV